MLAAIQQNSWWVAAVIILGSLLSVVYMWKILEVLFFRPALHRGLNVTQAPASLLIPMWVLVFANIYFGINTELTVGVAETAVKLLGVTTP